MIETSENLRLKFTDRFDVPLILAFAHANLKIKESELQEFFIAAKPVLGVVSLDEAEYLATRRDKIISII